MRIDLAFPALPPAHDAIGEHTARLASALVPHADVRILTAAADAAPIEGVEIERAFSLEHRAGVRAIEAAVGRDVPDWLVVQYNPFSWGRRGVNPFLEGVVQRLRRRHEALRVALLVHETAPPWLNWRLAAMSLWQRAQLRRLGRAADMAVFCIEPWARTFGARMGGTPVAHLPVGSNIPDAGVSRASAREALGLADGEFVVGLFGTAHHSRLLPWVRHALDALAPREPWLRTIYVGPHGPAVSAALAPHAVRDLGRLDAVDVSSAFRAFDVCLAPFRAGVSSRRGSFVVALQHGIPVVSTRGPHTGPTLAAEDGRSFLLADEHDRDAYRAQVLRLHADAALRAGLGREGRALYERHFEWERLAARLVETLAAVHGTALAPPQPLVTSTQP